MLQKRLFIFRRRPLFIGILIPQVIALYFALPIDATSSSTPPHPDADNAWCNRMPSTMRFTTRHIENKGIGYRTGYTTLEAFLAAPPDQSDIVPFLDLRGHFFNNGKWAANGGVGLRKIIADRVYGINAYYDYRNASKRSYNQLSFGLETLGTFWDARLNGYIVFNSRTSKPYRIKFDHFSGNTLYYSRRLQYALSGANGEIGFHPIKMKNVDVYTTIGPYYLKGPSRGSVLGVQTRASATWKDYISAEISYSYDHMFNNILQGQLSFSYPFGPNSKVKTSQGLSCKHTKLLQRRMVQPVMKNEIIPVHTQKQKRKAINPATGAPWVFWFVDNTSHSLGTFESPFPSLAFAQSVSEPDQAIYVFPGTGSTTNMDAGIILQDGQRLLGASVVQPIPTTMGVISIPVMASAPPNITNTGGDVVTLANKNVVSGLNINTALINTNGISGVGISDLVATQNTIAVSGTGRGILLTRCSGSAFVKNNTFSGGDSGFHTAQGALDALNVASCLFNNTSYGLVVDSTATKLKASNNRFRNILNESIDILGTVETVTVTGNRFTNCNTGIHNFGTIGTLNVFENAFRYLNFQAIVFFGGSTGILNAMNNTFYRAQAGIYNNGAAIGVVRASDNRFSHLSNGIVNSGTMNSLSATNNNFVNISGNCIQAGNGPQFLWVTDSTFNHVSSSGQGISYTAPANVTAEATILNNTFISGDTPSVGYATLITVNQAASTLCLRFTGNTAPLQTQTNVAAYSLNESGGATFNLTLGSDNTLNSGSFTYSGSVNPPGSCQQ